MKKPVVKVDFIDEPATNSNSRRRFIKLGGLAMAGSAVLFGCSDDNFDPSHQSGGNPPAPPTPGPDTTGTDTTGTGGGDPEGTTFDLGSGDLGILNYAYALEQLEAAFYIKVLKGAYFSGADDNEKTIFTDIRNHEVIHRDFFSQAISGAVGDDTDAKLPELDFDFSVVDFDSRDAVLKYSQILEDTGVKAYNGAGALLESADYLLIAGKIVSVEARHAAAIRDLIDPKSSYFAGDDVLIPLGDGSVPAFDMAVVPQEVIPEVVGLGFITTDFTADNLPTS